MTTVRTPRAAARSAGVARAGRELAPAGDHPDAPMVLPGSVRGGGLVDVGAAPPGDRLRRLERRKRLAREQILAATFLLVVLAITVGVLAMQWLGSGSPLSPSSAPAPSMSTTLSGGTA